jgi:putative membrane protein
MALDRKQWYILIFTLFYISAFSAYYLSIRNYEFIWYIVVILFFFGLIFSTLKKSKFDNIILLGLSLWGLLHLAGGGIHFQGDVLYNWQIIHLFDIKDTMILKFDQAVHAFGFGVSALVVFHLLYPYLNKKTNQKIFFSFIVMAAAGLGALNEVVEFIAVVSFPDTNVGGYENTALDIVFNFLGAILAVLFIRVANYKDHRNFFENANSGF